MLIRVMLEILFRIMPRRARRLRTRQHDYKSRVDTMRTQLYEYAYGHGYVFRLHANFATPNDATDHQMDEFLHLHPALETVHACLGVSFCGQGMRCSRYARINGGKEKSRVKEPGT